MIAFKVQKAELLKYLEIVYSMLESFFSIIVHFIRLTLQIHFYIRQYRLHRLQTACALFKCVNAPENMLTRWEYFIQGSYIRFYVLQKVGGLHSVLYLNTSNKRQKQLLLLSCFCIQDLQTYVTAMVFVERKW